jgi:hypothetical protein
MEDLPRKKSVKINNNNNNNNNVSLLSSLFLNYKQSNEQEEPLQRAFSVILDNRIIKRININDLEIKKNDDFSQIINAKLDEIQKNTENQFKDFIKKYTECFNKYKNRIIDYLKKKENNISKVIPNIPNSNNLLPYAVQNIFNKIINLTEIYNNIINNIEDNFIILNEFLMQNDLINRQKPLVDFLINNSKKICKSSLLSKFNFEEIDTSNISKINYYNKYLQYLDSEKTGDLIKSYTIKKDNIKEGLEFIKKKSELKNIKIIDVNKENLPEIINNITKYKSLLDEIEISKIDFVEDAELNGNIHSKNVSIKNGNLNVKYIRGLSLAFIKDNEYLINLSLEKIGLTNRCLNFLMNIFHKKEHFLKNLEYLSFSGNIITAVIEKKEENKSKIFEKLKIFDLSKNEIYKFELPLIKFPNLKCLDLSSNNMPFSTMMDRIIEQEKNKIVLFNNNIFISNCSSNNDKYNDYLNMNLPKLNCDLKKLNLCFTYDIKNQKSLEQLRISPAVKISLIKLDLSFCGLSTDVLINFLKNNFGLFSLQKLKLIYNNIQSDIFEKLLCDEILLDNINVLDISENTINCDKIEENEALRKFVERYTNLKTIKLRNTFFFGLWDYHISNDYENHKEYRDIYSKLIKDLTEKKRIFKFIIEEAEKDRFLEKQFNNLFSFKD